MRRRKVIIAASAAFAIGVAFAAQTSSVRANQHSAQLQERELWVPGTNMVMSAHEESMPPLAPPQ